MKKPTWLIKAGAKMAEKKPDILVGTGIMLMAGAAVLGCVQTAKHMNSILDEHNEELADIKENCPEEEQKAEIRTRYFNTSLSIVKIYAGPVAMLGIGATMICLGHGEMKKRYTIMAAAYETVSKAYDTYRKRISDKYGEDADYYGRYGVETDRVVDPGDPEKKEQAKRVMGSEDQMRAASPYFRMIDQDSFLFKECGGSPLHIRSQLEAFEGALNADYFNGKPIYYNDIIKWIFGNNADKMSDDGQFVGWYLRDPLNAENVPGSGNPIKLNISTAPSVVGDDDPREMLYVCIDPIPAGVVSLARGEGVRVRKGGKYIGQI